jgi:hypothetical protein
MGYLNSTNECSAKKSDPTIKEVLDARIEQARKRVEELCIKKAKLETLNMLDMPWYQIQDLFE